VPNCKLICSSVKGLTKFYIDVNTPRSRIILTKPQQQFHRICPTLINTYKLKYCNQQITSASIYTPPFSSHEQNVTGRVNTTFDIGFVSPQFDQCQELSAVDLLVGLASLLRRSLLPSLPQLAKLNVDEAVASLLGLHQLEAIEV